MSEDITKQNLGNIASNCKHIVMFLTKENWHDLLPRVRKFIDDTKNIYSQTKINKGDNLFRSFEKLLAGKIDKNKAEDFLYFYTRFQNLATTS